MKSNQTLKWSLRTAAVFVTFVRAEAAELWHDPAAKPKSEIV